MKNENVWQLENIADEIDKLERERNEWRRRYLEPREDTMVRVEIKRLHPDAIVPRYQTDGAAGFDLHAAEDMIIGPGEWALIPTGLAFEIPRGYEMQIRPRSGVSAKTKLRIANSPATIDCDYRGEVFVLIENIHPRNETLDHDVQRLDGTYAFLDSPIRENSCLIEKGDRIAQGVIQAVPRAQFEEVDALGETERGGGGFGSTGVGGGVKLCGKVGLERRSGKG